ncbi:pirin family protein [Aquihabitans sp. G128]|uniref:pirin family protein n=1 Tax=Aquihabitans sp. G128 TaxID=2849779 RepID=UPI001C23C79A|nr:pirin family protein [Aquihabitans sp. G128]QXC61741.1 pirin family protein [Aquihabitans sp. G128]
MSGPVTSGGDPIEVPPVQDEPAFEVRDDRVAQVGTTEVRRALPQRERRTVGAWCFADHFGPTASGAPGIGPHPHIGLQTVTWLLEGELLHRDSVGSEQLIRPGQLNLMTAGNGVTHAEEHPDPAEQDAGRAPVGHGVQLWVAQPADTRSGAPAFEHHAELPQVELAGATATVLVGDLAGARSPARADTAHVGFQVALRGAAEVPLAEGFEHAVLPLDGPITLDGRPLAVGQVAYLGPGRAATTLDGGGRALVLGGEPWEDRVVMWWNFVARSQDELATAYRDWQGHHERFGQVTSVLDRIPAPRPHWLPAGAG